MTDATRSPRKLIVHHHMFKNAGSSLDRALETAFGPSWTSFDSDDPSGRLTFDDVRPLLADRPEVKALSSHQLLPQLDASGFDLLPIVIIREPISRVRSAYLFEWQKQLGLDEPKGSLAAYVEQRLENPRDSVIGDFQIGRLSELERRRRAEPPRPATEERAERLALAVGFLDAVPVFGLVDRFDEFIRLLNLHLGSFDTESPALRVFTANVLQGTDAALDDTRQLIRAELGQGLFDELLARNAGDLELYDHACRRFDRLVMGLAADAPVDVGPESGVVINGWRRGDGVTAGRPEEGVDDDRHRALPARSGSTGGAAMAAGDGVADLAARLARLERRTRWQQDFMARVADERQRERDWLEALRTKYEAARRRGLAAEFAESAEPPAVPSARTLARAVRFGRRAFGALERRLADYPVSAEHQHLRAKISGSGLFDPEYYRRTYPDVVDAGWDPVDHFLIHGGYEGRAASELFDAGWYRERYPDVVEAGWHPLLHYLDHGEREGRQIRGPADEVLGPEPGYEAFKLPRREDFKAIAGSLTFPDHRPEDVEISVVVPIYNAIDYTLACLRSLTELQTRYRYEVVLLDDCSDDRDVAVLGSIAGLRYYRNERNLGFLATCNRAADLARGRYLVLLNNDTRVEPGWLDALRRTFDQYPDAGVVGSKLVYPDGRLQEAGGIIWDDAGGWNYGRLDDPDHPRYNYVRDVDYVSAASMMVEKDLFDSLGRFDERFLPAYYEDTDICFEARAAGRRVLYQPASVVVHYEGISSGTDLASGVKHHQVLNRITFAEKWEEALAAHGANGVDPGRAADRRPAGHVLIIDALTPTPDRDSGSLDMFNLITIIGDLGYRVHFVPAAGLRYEPGYTTRLQQVGTACAYEPHYTSVVDYLDECGDIFDTVILSRLDPAAAAIDAVLEHCPSARVLFYTVDLHFLRDRREAELTGDRQARDRAREREGVELELMDRVDVTIVLSEAERQLLMERGKSNVEVVPLIRRISQTVGPVFEDRNGVVFVGGFAHPPNVDAVDWLAGEIWPEVVSEAASRGTPAPTLSIVGSNTPEHVWCYASDTITVHGFVENLRPVFDRVRLSIAPLRFGAGLKGKVATSLDFGVPVVGTSLAFEGMPSRGLDEVQFCADDPRALAGLLLDLHDDRARWLDASVAARRYVRDHYSIEAVTALVAPLLGAESVTGEPGRWGQGGVPVPPVMATSAAGRSADRDH